MEQNPSSEKITRAEAVLALQENLSDAREKLSQLFGQWQEELGESLEGRIELGRRQAKLYEEAGNPMEALNTIDDMMYMLMNERISPANPLHRDIDAELIRLTGIVNNQ